VVKGNSTELGMVGLGRMGANMTERLVKGRHRVVGFDPKPEARARVEDKGAESAASLDMLVASLKAPRTLWMMVPAGSITDGTVTALLPLLYRLGDLVTPLHAVIAMSGAPTENGTRRCRSSGCIRDALEALVPNGTVETRLDRSGLPRPGSFASETETGQSEA
jgi:hypothetical protein